MESNCFRAVPSLHIHWTSSCYSLFGSIQERLGNLYIEWPRRSSLAVVGYYMITSGIDPQKTRLSSRPSTGTEYQWRARGKLWKHNFLGKASQNLWQIWRNMREIEGRGGAFLAVFRLHYCVSIGNLILDTCIVGCGLFSIFEISRSTIGHIWRMV